jgi:peroxiredoxin
MVDRPGIGEEARNFRVRDQENQEFDLQRYKGKRVLLSFHPLAWTPICAEQMRSLEKNYSTFESLNAVPVGVSVDTAPSKKAWAETLGIKKTRLLSDFWPHGEVAKLYGIFREKNGFSERANIVVDEDQKITFVKIYEIRQLPEIQEIISFLSE